VLSPSFQVSLCFLFFLATACASNPAVRHRPPEPITRCPTSLRAALPANASRWLFARPAAIYNHQRLGPLVARTFDAASERALIERSLRTGYDVRTLDRAAIAWTGSGTVYLASGALDTARVTATLWQRLLSPRRRARDEATSAERVEGALAHDPVALLVVPLCGAAAYAEGRDVRLVDRIAQPNDDRDPDDLLVWHSSQVPAQLARIAPAALAASVRELDLRMHASTDGLVVTLRLEGPLPADADARIRRALHAVIDSPIGDLSGASQWLDADGTPIERAPTSLTASVTIPWRALAALADALRGEVGPASID
jgi:hypothetical protein